MRRQFCLTHTVRYDEGNRAGYLTPAAFVRYMQELASRDAEDAQLSGDGYWVVKRTVISFADAVPIHTALELRTYGIGFTRITAQRGYEAWRSGQTSGEPAITARTLWVYVDAQGHPARLPEETARTWLPDGPQPQQAEAPFPALPSREPEVTSAVVRFSTIDLAGHLNNASAVELLDDAGWEVYARSGLLSDRASSDILHYDIEYLDSPRFGEQLAIQTWLDPFPSADQPFSRYQQIVRADKVVLRAHSRWLWRQT